MQRYGGLLTALAVIGAACLSGCSAGIGRPCEVDADCGENQICADEQCRRTCTTDEDCIDTTNTCRSWVDNAGDEPVNVCLPPADAGNPDADAGCTSDRQCQTRLDASSARCGLDGRCVIARPDYDGLLIRDRTEVAASGPQSRRGAEIGAIFLAADDGTPTHHARTVADGYRPGAGLGGESHLDGRSVDLDASGECVTTPLADHTTPLGGGDLLVEFEDPNGGPRPIEVGDRIAIVEWAQDNCGDSQNDSDEYGVYLCVSETDTLEPSDCDEPLVETATGYTAVSK